MRLNIPMFGEDGLRVAALPAKHFRGKPGEIYGLLPRMGIHEALRERTRGVDFFRVRPSEVALSVLSPVENKSVAPERAWLDVDDSFADEDVTLEHKATIPTETGISDRDQQVAVRMKRREYQGRRKPRALKNPRLAQNLEWTGRSLDFSSLSIFPEASFIERMGEGLTEGGGQELRLIPSHCSPYAGGPLRANYSQDFLQQPSLIVAVGKKGKIPKEITEPAEEAAEYFRQLHRLRMRPIVQGHVQLLDEFFPGVTLDVFTDKDSPEIVRGLGTMFSYAYSLSLRGERVYPPETADGRALLGFWSVDELSDLLIPLKSQQFQGKAAVTRDIVESVIRRRSAQKAA